VEISQRAHDERYPASKGQPASAAPGTPADETPLGRPLSSAWPARRLSGISCDPYSCELLRCDRPVTLSATTWPSTIRDRPCSPPSVPRATGRYWWCSEDRAEARTAHCPALIGKLERVEPNSATRRKLLCRSAPDLLMSPQPSSTREQVEGIEVCGRKSGWDRRRRTGVQPSGDGNEAEKQLVSCLVPIGAATSRPVSTTSNSAAPESFSQHPIGMGSSAAGTGGVHAGKGEPPAAGPELPGEHLAGEIARARHPARPRLARPVQPPARRSRSSIWS
jgi:hypothetical protein